MIRGLEGNEGGGFKRADAKFELLKGEAIFFSHRLHRWTQKFSIAPTGLKVISTLLQAPSGRNKKYLISTLRKIPLQAILFENE